MLSLSGNAIGTIFAVLAAASFGANRACLSRPLFFIGARAANYITAITGAVVAFLVVIFSQQFGDLLSIPFSAIEVFIVVGVLNFGISRVLSYLSVRNIGANQASVLSLTQVLFAFLFAVVFIGETLTPLVALGGVLVILGAMVIEIRTSAKLRKGSVKIGLAAIILASLVRGLTPVLIKYGLSGYPYAVSGTFVSYLGALIFNLSLVRPSSVASETKKTNWKLFASLVFGGIFVLAAQLLRFSALSLSPVVLVAPLTALEPIFTVTFTRFTARELEVFRLRTILGIATMVLGGVLVSYAAGG